MKTLAITIIAVVISLVAFWSVPAQAHEGHADPLAAAVMQGGETVAQAPSKHCDAGHTCHAQILPLVLAELAHSPACLTIHHPLRERLGHSLALAADPPPPRA